MSLDIRLVRRIGLLLALGSQSGCTTPRAPSALEGAYVVARLQSVEDVTPRGMGVSVDGTYRLHFSHRKTLAGTPEEQTFSLVRESGSPVPNRDYYLLVRGNGSPEVVWSSPVTLGFCDGEEAAATLNMRQAFQRLERRHPCRR
jgi:hypothetical protein